MPSPYRAPAWLPGGHAQTIWPLAIKPPLPAYRRERWETPDGDFIDLDRIDAPPGTPMFVLFHGLEGSSRSHYAVAAAHAARNAGWRFVMPHFRGCSGCLNRLPRAYHSGDSNEIDWILRRLRDEIGPSPLYAAGVSLGGNALLKWAGEQGPSARSAADAVAGISAPVDLAACGHHLGRRSNRLYTYNFLSTLKPSSLQRLQRHPGAFDAARLRAVRTLKQFDDAVTAPLHGFRDAEDYWQRAASKPWLKHIRIPALVLNARNDPFLPPGYLPAAHEVADSVVLEYPAGGGHAGFVSGPFPGHLDWLPQRLLHFFAHEAKSHHAPQTSSRDFQGL